MTRPVKTRQIYNSNKIFFKPNGIPMYELQIVKLTADEYEALRLKDYKKLKSEEAGIMMHISRQTFDRILNSARQKVADALVNSKAIEIKEDGFIIKKKINTEEKMKIIITSQGNTDNSVIDERFGRCAYFAEYDSESKEFNFKQNDSAASGGGAGIKTAQYVIDNADVLIGLNFGPNAYQTLEAGNIKVYNGLTGKTVKENIEAYLNNELIEVTSANVDDHSGMK